MKKRNYIKTALLALGAVSMLSSCLKDNSTTVDFTNAKGSLELPSAQFVGILQVAAFNISATPTALVLPVNLSGAKPSSSNTTATLAVDQAALAAYNTKNSTAYTLLPPADYTLPSSTVSIPAGSRLVNFNININTSKIDLTQTYALPITITDGGGAEINPNYKTVIFAIKVKNAYDGSYTETGYKFHPTPSACKALTGTFTVNTVSGTTSTTVLGDLGGSGYFFNFDVDATNKLTNWFVPAASAAPQPPGSGFFTADNPGGVAYAPADGSGSQPGVAPYVQTTFNNTYDAANKTFYMHYGYGVGATSQNGWTRNFYVKLVLKP